MKVPEARTLNCLLHQGGQLAAEHASLGGMAPIEARSPGDIGALPPLVREWTLMLRAFEHLEERLQSLGDVLSENALAAETAGTIGVMIGIHAS